MKLITLIFLGLTSLTLNAAVIEGGSYEDAAKQIVDRVCGGDGEILGTVWVDEDWDYVVNFVELSNGSASVYTFRREAPEGEWEQNLEYHEIEEGDVVCTNTRRI